MTTKQEIQVLTAFSNESKAKEIIQRRDKIAAVTGVLINILSVEGNTIKIRVEQRKLINNWILSQKDLVTRAKDLFKDILPDAVRLHYVALTFNPNLDEIDIQWVEERMTKYSLVKNDIIKHLNIDKATLSLFFSGERGLTKSQKSAFLYYFMVFEINRDLRA